MNDIEKKALALLNEVWADCGRNVTLDRFSRDSFAVSEALCRAIEQHEAFRQEVSDVVSGFFADDGFDRTGLLRRFIIAEPVDPLREVVEAIASARGVNGASNLHTLRADDYRADLADAFKRGMELARTAPAAKGEG